MPLGGYLIILLGAILMSLFFSILIGNLTILGAAFCATGWAFTTVGALAGLWLELLFAPYRCLLPCCGNSLVISPIC